MLDMKSSEDNHYDIAHTRKVANIESRRILLCLIPKAKGPSAFLAYHSLSPCRYIAAPHCLPTKHNSKAADIIV